MKPHDSDSSADSINPVASTAVGKRGTNPVSMNSITTELPITRPTVARTPAAIEKNASGRSSFTRKLISHKILTPSLYVFNLLGDPTGLFLYGADISDSGMR